MHHAGVQAAGWGLDTQIHALGDGAPWIAEQARVQFGTQGRYTLDLYHACDYLAAAAPDPAHAKLFVEPLREALRASDHPSVLATLRPREEPSDCPDEKAPVRAALRYLGLGDTRAVDALVDDVDRSGQLARGRLLVRALDLGGQDDLRATP